MNRSLLKSQQLWIQEELKRCIAFWLKHGMDAIHGGLYTCLDREGKIYSTDKSVWMQGRCAWIFSYLCRQYGICEQWVDAAKSCLDFMEKYCINREKGNRMYFTVTADGKPLRQRRYSFSENFYTIANAEYAALTGNEACMKRARDTYELLWKLNQRLMDDPVGMEPKTILETRSCRALADLMIYLNTSVILLRCDSNNASLYVERAQQSINDILCYHHKPELRCTLETVGMDGALMPEVTIGRVVSPGHAIECSWFMMEYANKTDNIDILEKAREMLDYAIALGWDNEYEGLLYYVDYLRKPTEAYEHDMKLWWPHTEMLIASLMAYRDTKNEEYQKWFSKTLEYCKRVFSDPLYGEWYGYLRRDGKPTMPPAKGSTFKGPFHLPRMLIMVDKILEELLSN